MAASLATKIRLILMGHKRTSQIVPMIVLLVMIYFVVRWASTPRNMGAAWQHPADDLVQFKRLDGEQIKKYIASMQDVRPAFCKNFELRSPHTVSIILDFNEHEFYDLKLTLTSIIEHTPAAMYEEIILLDDGTSTDRVRQDAVQFLNDDRFSKVRPFRSEDKHGPSASRFKAAHVAKGEFLVFIHSRVAVNKNWLEPLIYALDGNRRQIVIPHFDNFLSGYRFFHTPDDLVPAFSWTLNTIFMEKPIPHNDQSFLVPVPVMTGAAFAVDKEYLTSLGHYDDTMTAGGGENLELSLRTWMCGGSIHMARCSTVAQHNALTPSQITSTANYHRITEMWLPSYRDLIYRQNNVAYESDGEEFSALEMRKKHLFKDLKLDCKDAQWYLSNVAKYLHTPKPSWQEFGKLKSKTGFCIVHPVDMMSTVVMVMCKPHLYEASSLVEYLSNGQISARDKCLEYQAHLTDAVVWKQCSMSEPNQIWRKLGSGQIQLKQENAKKCLTHIVGNADKKHEARMQDCSGSGVDRSQMWEFIKY